MTPIYYHTQNCFRMHKKYYNHCWIKAINWLNCSTKTKINSTSLINVVVISSSCHSTMIVLYGEKFIMTSQFEHQHDFFCFFYHYTSTLLNYFDRICNLVQCNSKSFYWIWIYIIVTWKKVRFSWIKKKYAFACIFCDSWVYW